MTMTGGCLWALLVGVFVHLHGPGRREANIWNRLADILDWKPRAVRHAAFATAYLFLLGVIVLESVGIR